MDFTENQASIPAPEHVDGPIAELALTPRGQPLFIDHAFSELEVRLEDPSPPLQVVSGLEWPQARARYVIVQPAVLRKDPRTGWCPVGGAHPDTLYIGPGGSGRFTFASTITDDWLMVRAYETFLSLTACGSVEATIHVPVRDLLAAVEASARYEQLAAAA